MIKINPIASYSDADIDATAREIRIALLEADVALPVVKTFIERIRERAVGEEVARSLTPGQALVKISHNELVTILGGETRRLRFAKQPPTVIMLAGLQGTGKTTLAGKLGMWLFLATEILFFGGLWGFWGIFFAIPLATVIQAILRAWPREPAPEPGAAT